MSVPVVVDVGTGGVYFFGSSPADPLIGSNGGGLYFFGSSNAFGNIRIAGGLYWFGSAPGVEMP